MIAHKIAETAVHGLRGLAEWFSNSGAQLLVNLGVAWITGQGG